MRQSRASRKEPKRSGGRLAKPVPLWAAYTASVVLTVGFLFARLAAGFKPGDPPTPFLFVIPIIVSGYLGGLGPGLIATALSALFANYFLMEPVYRFSIASGIQRAMWLLFIVTGILISVLNEAMRRSIDRAEGALADLKRVEDALRIEQQLRSEEALRQSEQKLETALRAARMVSFVWDPVADVMQTTGDFAEIYGRPPITRSDEGFALVHPEDRQRHRATIEKTAREGG
ncbi:MAG TPA: DUF4118 domain-containing protein, partial [Candidatus Manganitrophaceae bacterium]|nr:DUF4118 domain-containing protein [Candidatus Manganitrophaceae bacterium]